MKKIILAISFIVAGLSLSVQQVSAAQGTNLSLGQGYEIGTGDVLDIAVWKDAALTKQVTVLPDGTIHFPLVGEINVLGMTVSQLKQTLEQKIERYVPDPVLSVGVLQVNSMLIYVIGKVNKPGRFLLNSNINVLQALAMAGGLNPFAREKQVRIFRENNGVTDQFKFNYDEVREGEKLEQNITLRRGDIIVVP
ncbi:MAG: polysaccharide export protein [Desulfobacteraceae bacterium]|nr:polysaccharide export protein [Desulfobacteraceae bacterium]